MAWAHLGSPQRLSWAGSGRGAGAFPPGAISMSWLLPGIFIHLLIARRRPWDKASLACFNPI